MADASCRIAVQTAVFPFIGSAVRLACSASRFLASRVSNTCSMSLVPSKRAELMAYRNIMRRCRSLSRKTLLSTHLVHRFLIQQCVRAYSRQTSFQVSLFRRRLRVSNHR